MKYCFDPLAQRYPSQRYPVYARGGMVNCSCPQAAAAVLTVTEPTANGIGGDAFALIWNEKERRLYGLNSSGPAPRAASIENVLADGRDEKGRMPALGWTPVTVPGIPKAWAEISRRFGALPLSRSLALAVRYAREGFPCAPTIAYARRGRGGRPRRPNSRICRIVPRCP